MIDAVHSDMSSVITLYDIPSTLPGKAWSPNVWKTRLSLSVKGLQYKTVWVEFPEIESVCKKIGAKPTSATAPHYTLPVIHDPSTNSVISNSIEIARYLDATYPATTPLFPPRSAALQEAFQSAFRSTVIMSTLPSIMLHLICINLNPTSETHYRTTREAKLGRKLEDLSPPGPQRDEHWKEAEKTFGVVESWLAANGEEKPFVMGDMISYADVTIAGFLLCLKKLLGPESQEWKGIAGWHGGRWGAFIDNFSKYEVVTRFL